MDELIALLESKGIDPSSTVKDGIPAVEKLEADHPGALAAALAAARRTAEAGVDPYHLLYRAAPVVVPHATAQGQPFADWFGPIADHAIQLQTHGIEYWSSTSFGFEHFVKGCAGDVATYARLLRRYGDLLLLEEQRGVSLVRTHQYGFGIWCQLAGPRPWAVEAVLDWCFPVVEAGGDVGWFLQLTLSTWWEFWLGVRDQHGYVDGDPPEPPPEAELERRLRGCLSALEPFCIQVAESGMSVGMPLATGLEALGRYGAELPDHLPGWLDRLLAVIRGIFAQNDDGSPYGPMRYGLPEVCRPGLVSADQLTLILDLGVKLADRGLDPGTVWHDSILAPVGDRMTVEEAVEVASRCADGGADPRFLLRDTLRAVLYSGADLAPEDAPGGAEPGEPAPDLVDRLVQLALTMAQHDMGLRKTFEHGFPFVARYADGRRKPLWMALDMAQLLADHGVAPGMTIAHGLSVPLVGDDIPPWVLDETWTLVQELAPHGVDPETTLSNAFVVMRKVAGNDRAAFSRMRETVTAVVLQLHAAGVDARDVLYRDIPAMAEVEHEGRAEAFERLLIRLREVLAALQGGGVDPAPFMSDGLPALARAAREQPWMLDAGLDICQRLGGEGVDPGPILKHGVPSVAEQAAGDHGAFAELLAAVESVARTLAAEDTDAVLPAAAQGAAALAGADPGPFGDALRTACTLLAESGLDTERRHEAAGALPTLAAIAEGDAGAYAALIERVIAEQRAFAAAERSASSTLWYGLRALARVAPGRAAIAGDLLEHLGTVVRATPVAWSTGAMLEHGLSALAGIVETDAAGFRRGLEALGACAAAFAPAEEAGGRLCRDTVAAAAAAAHGDAARFTQVAADLARFLTAPANAEGAERVAAALGRSTGLLSSVPKAWQRLVQPTLETHGPRAGAVLAPLCWIGEGWIRRDTDLDILAAIVTQTGVRAVEWLEGLIVQGLHAKVIDDLTAHHDTIVQFIRTVPFADPEIYGAFRTIQTDQSLSEQVRRARTDGLVHQLDGLKNAVRAGEVTREQERDPLFPMVLYYLFPPAMSSSRARYMELYGTMADRPEDLTRLEAGELRRRTYPMQQGAWELRHDVQLDLAPWELVTAVAQATPAGAPPEPPAALGWELLGRWAEGRIGRETPKRDLLGRVLVRAREAGIDVPAHAAGPAQLLACKEFLGDHVRDVVEAALIAAREQDTARYDRLVRDKLAPPATVGPGLVKSMWQLHEQLAENRVPAAAAQKRVAGQLKGFQVDPHRFVESLAGAADAAAVQALLDGLQPEEIEIEHGKEQQRLLADFVGTELSAMNRELFGGGGARAKLVYRISADAPPFELTCALTKRRAHAPIGICQGVCVATDRRLWENPDFLQVIFWGPDGIAAGGMHVLVVGQGGERFVALPGINPSMRLLNQVEPDAVLAVAADYAWRLARAWGCAGVWVPCAPVIHSNRRAIHLEIERRVWPRRATDQHQFSHSPYRYTFSEVFEVPEEYRPEAEPSPV